MPCLFQRAISPPRSSAKRKRRASNDEPLTNDDEENGNENGLEALDTQAREEEDSDEPIRPPNFPHAPFPFAEVPPASGYSHRNAKAQHITVVTAILHKSLLNGDWKRAQRSFGLLIRSSLGGARMNIRDKGSWGIGAEILLRLDTPQTLLAGGYGTAGDAQALDEEWFTAEGFKRAKGYYERLILQHPHFKRFPDAVNAMNFYPPMLGLWIMHVQLQRKRAEAELDGISSRSLSPVDSSLHGTDDSNDQSSADIRASRLQKIVSEEIQQAKEVADRLEELTFSPPFDRNAEVLRLRGRMASWMVDLCVENDSSPQEIVRWRRKAEEANRQSEQRSSEALADSDD